MQEQHTNTQAGIAGYVEGNTQGLATGPVDDCERFASGGERVFHNLDARTLHHIAGIIGRKVNGEGFEHPPFEGKLAELYEEMANSIDERIAPIRTQLEAATSSMRQAANTIHKVAVLVGPQLLHPSKLRTDEQWHNEVIVHLTAKLGGFYSALDAFNWMVQEINNVRRNTLPIRGTVNEQSAAIVLAFANINYERTRAEDAVAHEKRVRHQREDELHQLAKTFGFGGDPVYNHVFEFIRFTLNSVALELSHRRKQFVTITDKLGFNTEADVPAIDEVTEAIDNLKNLASNPPTPPTGDGLFTAEGLFDLFASYTGKTKHPFKTITPTFKDAWHSLADTINIAALQDRANKVAKAEKALQDENARLSAACNNLNHFVINAAIAIGMSELAHPENILARLKVVVSKNEALVKIADTIGLNPFAGPETILARVKGMQAELEALRAQCAANDQGGEH